MFSHMVSAIQNIRVLGMALTTYAHCVIYANIQYLHRKYLSLILLEEGALRQEKLRNTMIDFDQ